MIKMLCLTVLPILALWSYCVYQLTDIIATKTDNEKVTFHQNKFSPDVLNNNKYDCEIVTQTQNDKLNLILGIFFSRLGNL